MSLPPLPPGKFCQCGLPHETGGPCWECVNGNMFSNYDEAQRHQLSEWLEGRPWHNPWSPGATEADPRPEGGECCPDFSCCAPQMIWPQKVRMEFVEANDEKREGMLFGALSSLVADHDAVAIGDPRTKG